MKGSPPPLSLMLGMISPLTPGSGDLWEMLFFTPLQLSSYSTEAQKLLFTGSLILETSETSGFPEVGPTIC